MAGFMKKLMAGMIFTSALNSAQAKEAAPETTDAKQDKIEVTQDSPSRQAKDENTISYEEADDLYAAQQDGKKKGNGTSVENVDFDTEARSGGVTVRNGDKETSVRRTRNGTSTVQTVGNNGRTKVTVDKEGHVNVNTNVNTGNEEGVRNVKIDTENKSGRVVVGGKTEKVIRVSENSQSIEIGKNGKGVTISRSKNGKINISGNLNKKALGKLFGGGR